MDKNQVKRELLFRADRSSGSGGQHVNKVATKVSISFHVASSQAFSQEDLAQLLNRLEKKLTTEGLLVVKSQHFRSQAMNRKHATQKLFQILEKALQAAPPIRKATKRNVNTEKLQHKRRQHSQKKALRRKIRPHDVS